MIKSKYLFLLLVCIGLFSCSKHENPSRQATHLKDQVADILDSTEEEIDRLNPAEEISENSPVEDIEESIDDNEVTSHPSGKVKEKEKEKKSSDNKITNSEESSSSNDITSTSPTSEESNTDTEENTDVADSSEDTDEEIETDSTDLPEYTFNKDTGECVDAEGNIGRNSDEFKNCGDMNNQTIDGENFRNKDLYGISLEDTFITNSKVRINDLVEYEALINGGTKIDGIDDLVDRVFKAYTDQFHSSSKTIKKQEAKISKLKSQVKKLMKQYTKAKTDKARAKIENKLAKKQKSLEKLTEKINKKLSKRTRQKESSIKYGEM